MNKLSAGFARVDVTPMNGIGISGYYIPRTSEGVLDPLEICALALESGDARVLLMTIDNCYIPTPNANQFRRAVADVTGVPYEAVYIHATHTHTSPFFDGDNEDRMYGEKELIKEYTTFVCHKFADAAVAAIEDLKPAKMGYAVGSAPNVAFVRRFRMKDGKIRTNPGVNNPDIVHPIGDVDERVNVLRFDREGADSIALVNMGNHPDVVGGSRISADWPGMSRRVVEKAIDGVSCIFFNGVQGDVNHVNVHPAPGFLNDTFHDFDDVSRGYGHARYIARVVAGAVLQVWDKTAYTDVDSIRFAEKLVNVPANLATPEELVTAHKYVELHNAGKDEEIPFQGMELTTVVAEAIRMVRYEDGPETFPIYFNAISIGNVALFGIPGEPFTGVGRGVKEADGWNLVLPCCLTNGSEGYFPMKDAYDEGGYEARSSKFKSGIAELIVEVGKGMLKDLK